MDPTLSLMNLGKTEPKGGRSHLLSTRNLDWTDQTFLGLAAVYRLVVLLLLCTTFVPDEYFQYVEPSYDVFSGKGIR